MELHESFKSIRTKQKGKAEIFKAKGFHTLLLTLKMGGGGA